MRSIKSFGLLLMALLVSTVATSQLERSSIRQDAKLYADATLGDDFEAIEQLTYPGLFKVNGGKSRLKQIHIKDQEERIELKESRSRAFVDSIFEITKSGNRQFAVFHINYLLHNPGGVFTLSVPILGVLDAHAKSWKFLEAKKLANPEVNALFIELNTSRIPKFSTVSYLPEQKFTDQMVAYNRSLSHDIHAFDLDFQPPKGYLRKDTTIVLTDKLGHNHRRSRLSFKSETGILVCFTFNPIDTSSQTKLSGFPGPDGQPYDINRNWIPAFGVKYTQFPKSYSTEMFNADISGTYDFEPGKFSPVISKDEKCKIFFIHKDNWLDIEILYYYTADNEQFLEKVMQETRGMLKFRY